MKAIVVIAILLAATVVGLARATAAPHAGGRLTSANSKLGQILVDSRGRTLSLFEKDGS